MSGRQGAAGNQDHRILAGAGLQPGALEARAGRRVARALFDAMQSAPRELAATVKRAGIRADFDLKTSLRFIPPGQQEKLLRREIASREEAGLGAAWIPPAAIDALAGSMRTTVRVPELATQT